MGIQRADPNLIHWQRMPQPDVQQETRELVLAGSGHRPPSYSSSEMSDMAGEEGPVTPPLPLFAERRRAANVIEDL